MTSRLRRWLTRAGIALALAFLAIQFVPVERDNPPLKAALQAPVPVDAILRRSCYDCHSNEVRWPWYGYIAPVSWIVADDVKQGRKHLNFSSWNEYSAEKRAHKLEEIIDEVRSAAMPLKSYLWTHRNAKLSEAEIQLLSDWAAQP